MIYQTQPEDFVAEFEIALCICKFGDKILMLKRAEKDTFAGQWCFPGGTIHINEMPEQTVVREIKEETGIDLSQQEHIFVFQSFVKYPDYEFVEHVYRADFNVLPKVVVNKNEHQDFQWVRIDSLKKLQLLPNVLETLTLALKHEDPQTS